MSAPAPIVGRFGKLPAAHDPRAKPLAEIAKRYKLTSPRYFRVDWSRKLNVGAMGTLLNTTLGDCTCASKGHDIQMWTAWTGVQAIIADADILAMYKAISGYNGTPASDVGATIVDALAYWLQHGIAGHQLAGYAQAEPGNLDEIRTAIWNFGNCDIGLQLPETCLSQGVWRLVSRSGAGAPGSAGGHDVNVIGYDDHAQLLTCITWGHLKQMSYAFYQFYCDEAWALASKEWLLASNHLTPSDVDWTTLLADLNELRSI
jgi:hypothetical protein